MNRSWLWKLLGSFVLLGLALYVLIPTFVYFSLDEPQLKEVRENKDALAKYLPQLPSWAIPKHIVPGLDLQGGIHLVYTVNVNKAIGDKTVKMADRLLVGIKGKKLNVAAVTTDGEGDGTTIQVKFASADDRTKFESADLDEVRELEVVTSSDETITYRLDSNTMQMMKTDAVDQTIHTIRNRIDSMGMTEPSIAKRGSGQIQIQLPGYDNPDNAKALIGRTAQLEFQMCDDDSRFLTELKDLPEGVRLERSMMRSGEDIYLIFAAKDLDKVKTYLMGKVPEKNVVKFGKPEGVTGDLLRSYTLHKKVDLTGDDLVDARVVATSQFDTRPAVSMEFNASGARVFEQVTGANIGKRFAIVLEDQVDTAPVIQGKIDASSRPQITLNSAKPRDQLEREARELALVLKSGALPAPVTKSEERTVGPTLGADSVQNGMKAFMIGGFLIILFMIFYYRVGGLISVFGVTFNVIFILAAMALFGATISLPGIAGLLLTVGMAVDTNIIINERIREELRRGKMPRSAVKAGYHAAFSAVFDSHITTIIGGVVLFNFGSGPVQNFAATILIGTVFSFFTGIFVTRIFFEALTHKGPQTISI